ncbi:MAG: type II secretion system F family protein [Oligoflexia bacterium]|nr:type II secretion system F family protein [Oligoflexia bacterium]
MKAYVFQGKTSNGRSIKGQIEASSETEARVKLRAQRIIPLKVVEKGSPGATSTGGNSIFAWFGLEPKVKTKELQVFTRQFATMINSGIPIVQAIDLLAGQISDRALKIALGSIRSKLEGGQRLADSMEGWPKIFDRLYVSLVRAGEEGGVLDTILQRLAAYIEKSVKLKGKITGALWYPAGILFVSMIVVTLLLTFVIPKFESLFKGAGRELPALTQMVVNASHFLRDHYIIVLGTIAGIIFAVKRFYDSKEGRRICDTVFLQIPVMGSLIQKGAIARFTRTMSTMLGCGVGILDALDICSNVVGNYVLEQAILRSKVAIGEGRSITQPLSQEPYIPTMVVQMIGVGEATGTMDTMMGKIADFYEDEVDYAVGALTSIMEPLMMVFLGGIIAVLVIAMYLPIFDLAGSVK